MYTPLTCSWALAVCEAPARCWKTLDRDLRPRLQATAYRLLGDRDDAEDAVQETFLRAWRCAEELRDPGAWMRTVVRHVSLDLSRRRRRRTAESLDVLETQEPADRREPPPGLELAFHDSLRRLPASRRRALLAVVHGESLRDIAAREGASYAALKTRVSRARAALRTR